MHGKVAAGKFTDLQFDDDAKRIEAVAKVVDDTEWNKVLEGVYTGFSIGGKYGKTWDDQGHRRYEAIPAEGSLVDYPCIPSATFKVVKSDGSEEVRKFTGATEAIEAVDQLASLLDQGKLDPRELLRVAMTDLQKREFSQDKRDEQGAATDIRKTNGGDTRDDTDDDKGGKSDKGDNKQDDDSAAAAAAAKAAAADALAKAGRRNSASDQGFLQDGHDALVKAGAMCSKMDGDDDASQIDDDFALAAGVDELCKAAGLEPVEGDSGMEKAAQLVVSLAKAHARIKELEAMPAPTKGVLKAMTKAADMTVNQNATDVDLEAELERAAKAQVDGDPIPMVKFIHKYGARAIRPNGPIASK
ncbi:hypothetical protein [Burkholderia stagnalis]|nr:hypothetical protein [Burkholderia stagnalis]